MGNKNERKPNVRLWETQMKENQISGHEYHKRKKFQCQAMRNTNEKIKFQATNIINERNSYFRAWISWLEKNWTQKSQT